MVRAHLAAMLLMCLALIQIQVVEPFTVPENRAVVLDGQLLKLAIDIHPVTDKRTGRSSANYWGHNRSVIHRPPDFDFMSCETDDAFIENITSVVLSPLLSRNTLAKEQLFTTIDSGFVITTATFSNETSPMPKGGFFVFFVNDDLLYLEPVFSLPSFRTFVFSAGLFADTVVYTAAVIRIGAGNSVEVAWSVERAITAIEGTKNLQTTKVPLSDFYFCQVEQFGPPLPFAERPRIVDTIPFLNELDLLEVRLQELYPVVDRFVVVEIPTTIHGGKKPLFLRDHRARFARFDEKLRNYVLRSPEEEAEMFPEVKYVHHFSVSHNATTAQLGWTQLRALLYPGTAGFKDSDLVIMGDMDEIPRRGFLQAVRTCRDAALDGPNGILYFRMDFYYYNFMWMWKWAEKMPVKWTSPYIARISLFHDMLPCLNREKDYGKCYGPYKYRGDTITPSTPLMAKRYHSDNRHGGWHLSYFGGLEVVTQKLQASLHMEHRGHYDEVWVRHCMDEGRDLFRRKTRLTEADKFTAGALGYSLQSFHGELAPSSLEWDMDTYKMVGPRKVPELLQTDAQSPHWILRLLLPPKLLSKMKRHDGGTDRVLHSSAGV